LAIRLSKATGCAVDVVRGWFDSILEKRKGKVRIGIKTRGGVIRYGPPIYEKDPTTGKPKPVAAPKVPKPIVPPGFWPTPW